MPFAVLSRTFFSQFFSSESVTSDEQLRQAIIGILAFLITPGLVLMIMVDPWYHIVELQAARFNRPELIAQALLMLATVWVNYAMVSTGFIAVLAWDSLSFDRRDAMVLGPMPVGSRTIIGAKLAALAAFLIGAAGIVSLASGLPYAAVTSGSHGLVTFFRHLAAHLTATLLGAVFVCATIVTIRGALVLSASERLTAIVGSLLQFAFVCGMLLLVPLADSDRERWRSSGLVDWFPSTWFIALFEFLRGSPRPDFVPLALRAIAATSAAVIASVGLSIAAFRRQSQRALAPAAFAGPLGGMRIGRAIGHLLVRGRPSSRALVDFVLLTIARNRPQQSMVAMNAGLGAAIVAIALIAKAKDMSALMQPRTIVLWIPLVLAYWAMIGLRASFFVPTELPSSWAFRLHGAHDQSETWSTIRAALVALVAPPAAMIALLLTPLVGWRVAAWHTALTVLIVFLTAGVIALTVRYIPYTRPYQPGHSKLRLRWPVYLLGMFAVTSRPVRIELALLGNTRGFLIYLAGLIGTILVVELIARRVSRRVAAAPVEEPADEPWTLTALNIGRT